MKFVLIIFSIIISVAFQQRLFSQNLPNYEFEEWVSDETFYNPHSWGTSNFTVFSIISFNTVFKETTDVYSGNTCAKLVTVAHYADGDDVKVAGLITLGHFDVNLATRKAVVKGGIPCTSRPSLLSGYYKYSTPGIDSCIMSIYLTKFNSISNNADTLGFGIYSTSERSEWTYFETPVNYSSSESPDTMNIIILSSDTSLFVEGSTLYIDKLAIDVATQTIDNSINNKTYSIFPNPAKEILFLEINTPYQPFSSYSIINTFGITVKQSFVDENIEIIDITSFTPGIYYFKLILGNNHYTESLIIY